MFLMAIPTDEERTRDEGVWQDEMATRHGSIDKKYILFWPLGQDCSLCLAYKSNQRTLFAALDLITVTGMSSRAIDTSD
jgi:hypothetical protein